MFKKVTHISRKLIVNLKVLNIIDIPFLYKVTYSIIYIQSLVLKLYTKFELYTKFKLYTKLNSTQS